MNRLVIKRLRGNFCAMNSKREIAEVDDNRLRTLRLTFQRLIILAAIVADVDLKRKVK